jgi:putative redox protein
MNAKVTWTSGYQFVGVSKSGHGIVLDSLEGSNNGPTPMELVLMGLCGCTGMDIISILQKMKKDVRRLWVEAEADRAEEPPKVYTKIHLKYRVEGRGVDAASVEKAVKLSEEKYCSVGAMLSKACPITSEVEIVEAP